MQIAQRFLLNTLVALAYFISGVIGSLLAIEPSNSSPVWPAAGVALAVMLIYGRRAVFGLFIGVFFAQVYVSFDSFHFDIIANNFFITSYKAVASTVQAVLGAFLIKRLVRQFDVLLDFSQIALFFFYGAVLSCLLAPTLCISLFYIEGIISASDFLLAWITWWVGDVVGVLIFTPIVLCFFAQEQTVWQPRRQTVATPLLFLLLVLVLVFTYSTEQESARVQALFTRRVEQAQDALEREMLAHKHITENMQAYFDASNHVSAAEFQVMARLSLQYHPDIIAIEWIPRILEQPKLPFSTENTAHYPIKYVEPLQGNERALGYDALNNKKAITTLAQVVRSGELAFTGLVSLIQNKQQIYARRPAAIIYAPVYAKNTLLQTIAERERFLEGVVAVVFTIGSGHTEALAILSDNQLLVEITDSQEIFYSNFSTELLNVISFISLQSTKAIVTAGTVWQITYRPSAEFMASQTSWHVWWTLLGCLVLTSFAAIGLLVLTGRTIHISEQVALKTQDLSAANKQLKQEGLLRQKLQTEQISRSEILELLAKGEEFTAILTKIVAGVEALDKQVICSILLLDETGEHLRHGAAISLPDFYIAAIDGVAIGDGIGSCGTAAYNAEQVIVEDIMTHPYWVDFKGLARQAGVFACWSEPVISANGKVLGTLAMYYREPKSPDQESLQFIKRMADLTAITIERKQAEDELRIAASTFQSHEAVVITDVNSTILRVNQAYVEITGYATAEVLGKNSRILSSGRHDKAFFVAMYATLAKQGRWTGEVWNKRKNGGIFPERLTVTAVYDGLQITHYVGIFSDISQQKASEEEIKKLAFFDPLTSLPNRRLLLDRLDQAVINAKRHTTFGVLIFMDLDRFKVINDTQGHQIGDELLVQISRRITEVIRKEDTACRLGGDEFVVLIAEHDKSLPDAIEHGALVAEKIRQVINEPIDLAGNIQQFSTSIGVAVFPDAIEKSEEILEQADTAMYRSKQLGRNQVSFFSAQMQAEYNNRIALERQLRVAMAQQQFVVYYQGQVEVSGKMVSAEALLRWELPGKGLVSPAEFIPIAEESNLIVEMGAWV
ncbi:MAG: diguanylate cyclase, partial [Methyloprofundus sp.]|nr:diguanylate cyclase [Methyloprofundus sp.]